MNLQEIERLINSKPTLRVKGLLKRRQETPAAFLYNFFTRWNKEGNKYDTILTSNEELQTLAGKRRSFTDLYLITKYYYPTITISQFRDIMCSDIFSTVPRMRTSWCEATQQRMWYQGLDSQSAEIMNKRKHDEYGNTWKQLKEAE